MKFKVLYSQEKDINNYLNSVWQFSYLKHGREGMEEKLLKNFPENFKEDLKTVKTKEEATKIIKNFLDNLPIKFKEKTLTIANEFEVNLNNNHEEIIKLLESLYQKSFPFPNISVYLTTLSICPYNFEEKWFMVCRNGSIDNCLSTSKHELNHFMFYYYYSEKLLEQGLSWEKIEEIKEALTILTNSEGNDKPNVKELESRILTLKEKPMDEIIDLILKNKIIPNNG